MSFSPSASGASRVEPAEASPARMYNFYLGGKDNYAVDRKAALSVIAASPDVPTAARENARCLGRMARWAASDLCIRSFVDIGVGLLDGIPEETVEQAVHAVAEDAQVVAVDNDPTVLSHGLAVRPGYAGVFEGDLRDLDSVFGQQRIRALVDFSRPVGVILGAVGHFVPDLDGVLADLRSRLAPGSALLFTHALRDDATASNVAGMTRGYTTASSQIRFRTRDKLKAALAGWEVVDPPGLVPVQDWVLGSDYRGTPTPTVCVAAAAALVPGRDPRAACHA